MHVTFKSSKALGSISALKNAVTYPLKQRLTPKSKNKKSKRKSVSKVESIALISLGMACIAIGVDMAAPPIAIRMQTTNVFAGVANAHASFGFDSRFGSRQTFLTDAVTYGSAVHEDSQIFATAHFDGTVAVWDLVSGERLQSHQVHSDAVEDVVFSPSGRLVASGGWD
ncbi:MAG: hypothetical protein AAGA83_08135, partial [Cyanobacteria bacterium P01_F01_bin.116]